MHDFNLLYRKNFMDNQDLNQLATQVRRDIVRMVHGASSGHPGGSLGCADLLTLLYFEVMKLPQWDYAVF